MVVFKLDDYVTNVFIPLYLDKVRGSLMIQTLYPNALTLIWYLLQWMLWW